MEVRVEPGVGYVPADVHAAIGRRNIQRHEAALRRLSLYAELNFKYPV